MDKYTSEEFRIVHPCGKILWVWFRSYPIKDSTGSGKQKAISVIDITDRKQIEKEQLGPSVEQVTQQEPNLAARIQRESLLYLFMEKK